MVQKTAGNASLHTLGTGFGGDVCACSTVQTEGLHSVSTIAILNATALYTCNLKPKH